MKAVRSPKPLAVSLLLTLGLISACQSPPATGIRSAHIPSTSPPASPPASGQPPALSIPPQNLTAPPQSVTAPPQGLTAPPQGVTAPPQGITAPPQGITAPPQGITAPPQGFTYVQTHLAPGDFRTQGFRVQSEASRLYLRLNGQLVPQAFTAAADGGWNMTALVPSGVFSGSSLRAEVGEFGGLAREYSFALPTNLLASVSLTLFPAQLRKGEVQLLAAGQSSPLRFESLNLPELVPALVGQGLCQASLLSVGSLKLAQAGEGRFELSWTGDAPIHSVRIDGALHGETNSRSMLLTLSGRHLISVAPRLDGCLLPPTSGASLLYDPAVALPVPVPVARPSSLPSLLPTPAASASATPTPAPSPSSGIDIGLGLKLDL